MDHVNEQAKIRVREAQLTKGGVDLDTPCLVRDTEALRLPSGIGNIKQGTRNRMKSQVLSLFLTV